MSASGRGDAGKPGRDVGGRDPVASAAVRVGAGELAAGEVDPELLDRLGGGSSGRLSGGQLALQPGDVVHGRRAASAWATAAFAWPGFMSLVAVIASAGEVQSLLFDPSMQTKGFSFHPRTLPVRSVTGLTSAHRLAADPSMCSRL